MVLRSGIIIPFQFRDAKKLLMIGVPEENRDLSIWDLKNVVRAAFGIYNFEFRNKKIGFNIPDELLLHYLAQRHDLTNFVIEIGQVYDPCKDNYTHISNCHTCHCAAENIKPLDLHEANTSLSHQRSHSNVSATTSQHSQYAEETSPPLKLRITANSSAALLGGTVVAPEISHHIEVEPKIDFDADAATAMAATEGDDDNEDDAENSPAPHDAISFVDQEPPPLPTHEMHFERMQHEYFLQQQQQHQQQQQQQHLEVLLQETGTNNLRQRKERMSKKQKEIYVNFLEQNPLINEHRRNDPLLDRYWMKLADILNSVPQGAVKHVAEWKQTFDNWRYRVYLYARYNSKIIGEAALNPKSFKPLTNTDKRAYSIWIRNSDTAPPDLEKMRNVFVNLEETLQE